jgi:hypothetical protein
MYYYVNGKKVQHKETFIGPVIENLTDDNDKNSKKCPVWVLIGLGVITFLVAIWLIYSIIYDKKVKTLK